jgi:hypothetical protein
MSNPTGDALVAAGVVDTQKLTDGVIQKALLTNDRCKSKSSDRFHIVLGIAVGAAVLATLIL